VIYIYHPSDVISENARDITIECAAREAPNETAAVEVSDPITTGYEGTPRNAAAVLSVMADIDAMHAGDLDEGVIGDAQVWLTADECDTLADSLRAAASRKRVRDAGGLS
jgi:hypothetical protein